MKDASVGPFTHHYTFRQICGLPTQDFRVESDFALVDCPACATLGVLQGETTKRVPTSDPYVHHYLLSPSCALAGPEPNIAFHFEKIDCPICTSLRWMPEEALEQFVEEIEMDILREYGTLELAKIDPHGKDGGGRKT